MQGIPIISMGDEYGQTSKLGPADEFQRTLEWNEMAPGSGLKSSLFAFVKALISFRRRTSLTFS